MEGIYIFIGIFITIILIAGYLDSKDKQEIQPGVPPSLNTWLKMTEEEEKEEKEFVNKKYGNKPKHVSWKRWKEHVEYMEWADEQINYWRRLRGEAPIGASEEEKLEARYEKKQELGYRMMDVTSDFRFQEYFDRIEKEYQEKLLEIKNKSINQSEQSS